MQKLLSAVLLIQIIFLSCQKNNSNNNSDIKNQPQANSAHLFELGISDSELLARKNTFLNSSILTKIPGFNDKIININTSKLNTGKLCPTPRIALYNFPNVGSDIYCLELPKEFRNNIPSKIKEEIISKDLRNLDLYIFVQSKMNSISALAIPLDVLRVHNWAYPNIPLVYGALFNRDLYMTAYSVTKKIPLSNQIQENKLIPFNVNLHDNLVSPDNAHMGLATAPNINFAFYTLVIDKLDKRAIVTFHWLIKNEDYSDDGTNPNRLHSLQYLNKSFPASISLNFLITRIKALPNFNSPTDEAVNNLQNLIK
ncbi:hypothetical protein QEJ31_03135 [Pigmentibacter sp. JX0631]|uniref:hypothetical protein n=1 Tax=Pigmentibacter sp. JX0631 TaxID=2976982 RepID=UPI002469780C|nr:hypothetical protein [Pigmentibacter sp. JX0631]WGL60595.1 hypothetical protein QEJ31_03135 [Pigmentibacter sp. JX0631]